MNSKAQKKTIVIRATLAVAFVAGSVVFPLLFLLAAFLAWTIYSDFKDATPTGRAADAWHTRRWTATSDDPEWKTYFVPFCESPAEEAFLEAMITDYNLLPNAGMLVGSGLELNLQVKHRPYRVDFLVDKWLVVEIDGAAWHSSQEAIERDRVRDEFFFASGFSVVRIPAKVVFNNPKRAVEMVRAAVARGAPPKKVTAAKPSVSVGQTLKNSVTLLGSFMDDLDSHVTKATTINRAMAPSEETFATERKIIDSAIEVAKRKVSLEATLNANPRLRDNFDQARARLDAVLNDTRMKPGENGPLMAYTLTIAAITAPATHQDPETNRAMVSAHSYLVGQRSRYFAEVREQLRSNPGIAPHVKYRLQELGCLASWREIEAHA